MVHRFHRILYRYRDIGALEVVYCPYWTQAPYLFRHMRPLAAHMQGERGPRLMRQVWDTSSTLRL